MAQAKKRIEDQNEGSKTLNLAPLARLVRRAARHEIEAPSRAVRALGLALDLILARQMREPARRAALTAARRAARAEAARAEAARMATEAANDVRPLTPVQIASLAEADQLEAEAAAIREAAKARKPGGKGRMTSAERAAMIGKRARALALRSAVERLNVLAVETAAATRRMRETEALEAGRGSGEAVERMKGQWSVRVRNRDGLKLLHERGAFIPRDAEGRKRVGLASRIEADRMMAVGLRYRDRFEVAQASMKSCLDIGAAAPAKQETLWEATVKARARVERVNRVREWEALVAARVGPEGVMVLRAVAGEGRSVSELAKGRRKQVALTALLVSALLVIVNRPLDERTR